MKPKLLVSFSGGKTSAYMSYILKRDYSNEYDLKFVFANTGQEHEKTLEFVDRVDREFLLNLVWVEAVVNHDERKGTTYKTVNFESASRDGEPFEEVIKKYGIPNKAYPHCNRELKLAPIHSWAKEKIGNDYLTAIGIRADESNRVRSDADKDRIVYPLCHWVMADKIDVNNFWEDQDFNLEILEHQGNCKTCWKKSDRKLFMLAKENREFFDFFDRMEKEHGLSGHNKDGNKRVFFRSGRSTDTLLKQADLYNENNNQISFFDLDENSGCTEECQPF